MEAKATITGQINARVLKLLEQHPDGLSWSELISKIKAADPNLHPKTVNGCIWKLVERFPDKVYKPSKGIFRLLKYKSRANADRIKICSRGHRYVGPGPCPVCWPGRLKGKKKYDAKNKPMPVV